MEHFFPNSSGHLRSDAHQSQIIGGDANVDHTVAVPASASGVVEASRRSNHKRKIIGTDSLLKAT